MAAIIKATVLRLLFGSCIAAKLVDGGKVPAAALVPVQKPAQCGRRFIFNQCSNEVRSSEPSGMENLEIVADYFGFVRKPTKGLPG